MIVAILPSLLNALLFGCLSAPTSASVISRSLPIARVFVLNGVCVTLICLLGIIGKFLRWFVSHLAINIGKR